MRRPELRALMSRLVLNHDRPRLGFVLAVLAVLTLVSSACGGGGDGNADEPTGDATTFTIWAPTSLQKPVEGLVARFEKKNPDITIEAVYAPGLELDDRLLLGEKPDIYVGTALNIEEHKEGGLKIGRTVVLGEDRMELVVTPGNPKQIADLSVFGLDPTTSSGLCPRELGCGRSARTLLEKARVTPEPDSTAKAGQLVNAVGTGSLDAALVYRSQSVKARLAGTIEYVQLPTTQRTAVEFWLASFVSGEAADAFLDDFEASPPSIKKILGRAGLASLEGESQ